MIGTPVKPHEARMFLLGIAATVGTACYIAGELVLLAVVRLHDHRRRPYLECDRSGSRRRRAVETPRRRKPSIRSRHPVG